MLTIFYLIGENRFALQLTLFFIYGMFDQNNHIDKLIAAG